MVSPLPLPGLPSRPLKIGGPCQMAHLAPVLWHVQDTTPTHLQMHYTGARVWSSLRQRRCRRQCSCSWRWSVLDRSTRRWLSVQDRFRCRTRRCRPSTRSRTDETLCCLRSSDIGCSKFSALSESDRGFSYVTHIQTHHTTNIGWQNDRQKWYIIMPRP